LPIRGTRFSTRSPRLRDAHAARERRSLAIHGAARGVEFLFQFVVFATEALPLGLRATQILAESLDLTDVLFNDVLRVTRRRLIATLRHAPVMPDSRAQYKRKLSVSPCLCGS
jgi:hypothetical protein